MSGTHSYHNRSCCPLERWFETRVLCGPSNPHLLGSPRRIIEHLYHILRRSLDDGLGFEDFVFSSDSIDQPLGFCHSLVEGWMLKGRPLSSDLVDIEEVGHGSSLLKKVYLGCHHQTGCRLLWLAVPGQTAVVVVGLRALGGLGGLRTLSRRCPQTGFCPR